MSKTIHVLPSGKVKAVIRYKSKFLKNKIFECHSDALHWAEQYDANVSVILSLKRKKLQKLTSKKINKLGGVELFRKLGVQIKSISFQDAVDLYMHQWPGKDPGQKRRMQYWVDCFGSKLLIDVDSDDIRRELAVYAQGNVLKGGGHGKTFMTNKRRSSATVARLKSTLSGLYRFAISEGYVEVNPVKLTGTIKQSNGVVRWLSDEERLRLLGACKESSWSKLYLLVLMALTTGARRSELMYLQWSDIDFINNTAVIGSTKNGASRTLTFPAVTMVELKKYKSHGLVFPSPTKPSQPFEFRKHWYQAMLDAEIESFRFHDLRHSAASYLAMGNASTLQIAEVLGHKSLQTTKRYAHLSVDSKAALTERLLGNIAVD